MFLAVLGLLVIGIVMLFSTSAYARDSHGDVYFFIKRQAIWIGLGLAACVVAALVNYQFWQKTWWLWFGLALAALRRLAQGAADRLGADALGHAFDRPGHRRLPSGHRRAGAAGREQHRDPRLERL